MENEENRGLSNKNDFEDQLASSWFKLGHFSVGALFYSLSLSLSHILGDLELSWSTLDGCGILGILEKEGKGREGKHKKASVSSATSYLLAGTELHV